MGELAFTAREVPGHTNDSLALAGHGIVLTGDSLLVGGLGRADFLGSDPALLFESVRGRLMSLTDETVVLPGHNYADILFTTIGHERRVNPALRHEDGAASPAASSAGRSSACRSSADVEALALLDPAVLPPAAGFSRSRAAGRAPGARRAPSSRPRRRRSRAARPFRTSLRTRRGFASRAPSRGRARRRSRSRGSREASGRPAPCSPSDSPLAGARRGRARAMRPLLFQLPDPREVLQLSEGHRRLRSRRYGAAWRCARRRSRARRGGAASRRVSGPSG